MQRCKTCHEPAIERAPDRSVLRQYAPENIAQILRNGLMAPMAQGLSREQIVNLAGHLAGRPVGSLPPTADKACGKNPPIRMTATSWSRYGIEPGNGHFQRNGGLNVRDVPKLKLKWSFAYAGGVYGQPIVVGDHLFITSAGGQFYSLDANSGCVHWMVSDLRTRSTPSIEHRPDISPSGWVTFLSMRDNTVAAFDAQEGHLLWRSEPLETVGFPHLTSSPMPYKDQVFAGVSSGEESIGTRPDYACCIFRGSLVALDARTGKRNWKTAMIQEPLQPTRKNADGVQLQGPAGASIWAAPTIDVKRNVVYVGTGNSYSEAKTKGTNAIVALDMQTGAIKWTSQTTEADNYLVTCNRMNRTTNCPDPTGPDVDYGAAPVLKTLPDGRDILVAGQKSGVVFGFDPDTGKVLWATRVGQGSTLGGVEWGIATDDRNVYAPNSDLVATHEIALRQLGQLPPVKTLPPEPKPGLTALDLATGKIVWFVPTPRVECNWGPFTSRGRAPYCFNAQSAAVSVIPGAVFSGTTDGRFRAYSTVDGKILWEYDTTAQTYDTVNGVRGQRGGSIDGMAPVIAGGVVYTMSGYSGSASTGSNPTNVLLAFSVNGK